MQILGRDFLLSLVIGMVLLLLYGRVRRVKVFIPSSLSFLLCLMAMTVVFSLTGVSPISGFHVKIRLNEVNLFPLWGIIDLFRGSAPLQGRDILYIAMNVGGNIAMFGPLGFLAPLLSNRVKGFWKTALCGLLVSLLIECSQLFLSRGSDVDDLLLNTAGAMLGYGCYQLFRRWWSRLINRLDMKSGGLGLLFLSTLIPYLVIVAFGFWDRWLLIRA